MKQIFFILFISMLSSCSVTNYYQVFKVTPDRGLINKSNIVFEDKNCIITYNLWNEGGNIGFDFFNKTDNDIIVDLSKTFFVINGVAYEYFQNRTFSNSSTSASGLTSNNYLNSSKLTGTNISSQSISRMEKSVITIPSKTLVYISEFSISKSQYFNCSLEVYPSKNKIKPLIFDSLSSPFVFSNLITYKTKSDSTRVENKFYVNEITNIPYEQMVVEINKDKCGNNLVFPVKVIKNLSPDKFYIHYEKKK